MTMDDWIQIAKDIEDAYELFDGFVILHGTDTLAYTASALSFMLENLGKCPKQPKISQNGNKTQKYQISSKNSKKCQKIFSNFSCRFLNHNNFFQFEL